MQQAATLSEPTNLLARFLRGRKWYGAEWYMTMTGGLIVAFIVVLTLLTFFTPRLAPYDPESRVGDPFTPPCTTHIFGTDQLGRDIFSRIIYGAQIVLQVALLSAVFSFIVGVPLGLISGFLGGWLDRVLSLVMDSIYSFPGLILAIALAALLGAGVLNMSVAIAVVYAESRYIAEDALEDIVVDYEPLEVVTDLERALEPDAPLVHDDLDSNLASHLIQNKGDYAAAREKADLVIKRRIVIDRCAAAAMENRGVVAQWEEKSQYLTVWDTTQAPIPVRNGLAGMLGLSEHQVRVIAPFVGGGFGPKIMMFLPVVFTFMFINFASGLVLYWFVNNLLSIAQQYVINHSPD